MKRKIISVIITAALLFAVISAVFTVSAATSGISVNTKSLRVTGGLTVTVTLNAGEAMYATEAYVSFDSSLLKFTSGTSANLQGGKVKIVGTPGGAPSQSYTLYFTAIAEGTASLSLSNATAVTDGLINLPSQSVGGIVISNSSQSSQTQSGNTDKKPADNTANNANADLGAITITGGYFYPEFSPSVTDYTVTVENGVTATTVNASPAYKKATVTGAGDFNLQEGDNPITIIVTAVNGTKKTYNFNIRRLTVAETMNVNPLATVVDGQMYHIVSDLSGTQAPQNFSLDNAEYNSKPVNVFKSADGEYSLFLLQNDTDGSTDYYIYRADRDEFKKVSYITVAGIFCILEDLPEKYSVPDGYYCTTVNLEGKDVTAFCSNSEDLIDFYYIYCYAFGAKGFYRYDMKYNTLQRAPEFSLAKNEKTVSVTEDFLAQIKALTLLEKILAGVSLILLIAVISLSVILANSNRHRKKNLDKDGMYMFDSETEEFLSPFNLNEPVINPENPNESFEDKSQE